MKYKGIELKEFTSDKPVLFDPPRKMLVWNRNESEVIATFVFAFCPSHVLPVNSGFFLPNGKFMPTTNYHCCAEIPESVNVPKVAKDYGIAHGENAENKLHAEEKNAYAKMRRGFLKLKKLLAEKLKGGENAG